MSAAKRRTRALFFAAMIRYEQEPEGAVKEAYLLDVRDLLRKHYPELLMSEEELETFKSVTLKDFTIYWKHGERTVIRGTSIEDAFTRAGFGAGAVAAVDVYVNGDVNAYKWESTIKNWMPVKPAFNPTEEESLEG